MPSILLVRHAQASFGTADYDVLSDRGWEQVQALAAGLRERGVRATRMVSGDLRRQRDTAEPCAEALGVELEIDARWNEYQDRDVLAEHSRLSAGLELRPGDEPMSSREFQDILNDALAQWIQAGAESRCRETWPAFESRVGAALEGLAGDLGRGETAVAVSSGGVIAALSARLMGLPGHALIAFNHVSINAAITKLAVGRGGITLISANEHAHLEHSGVSLVSYR